MSRWTQEHVWSKIEKLVPTARCWMAMPQGLKAYAVQAFLLSNSPGGTQHLRQWDDYVVAECLEELNLKGWLTFGPVEEDWL